MLTSSALHEYVQHAAKALGREVIKQPPIRRLPGVPKQLRLHQSYRSDAEALADAKLLTRFAAQRYRIPLPQIAVRLTALEAAAARIQLQKGMWYVDLCREHCVDREGLAVTIAHELAHVVLFSKGVLLEPVQRNEELTDTAVVLAGYGAQMLQTSERTVRKDHFLYSTLTRVRLGYLPQAGLRQLCRIHRIISRDTPVVRRSNLDPLSKPHVDCVACRTRCRLPTIAGQIKLVCPTCGVTHRLRLAPGSASAGAPTVPAYQIALRGLERMLDRWNGYGEP